MRKMENLTFLGISSIYCFKLCNLIDRGIVQFMGRRVWGSCPACKLKERVGVIHSYKIYNIVIMISAMHQQRLSCVLVFSRFEMIRIKNIKKYFHTFQKMLEFIFC